MAAGCWSCSPAAVQRPWGGQVQPWECLSPGCGQPHLGHSRQGLALTEDAELPRWPWSSPALGREEMAKLTDGELSWRRWPASLWPAAGKGTCVLASPSKDIRAGARLRTQRQVRMLGRDPGRSPGPGSGPQQEPRQMARIKQSMDSRVHGQASTRQPAQTAGPRQSRLLLRIPHPKATPECTTLWARDWRSALPVSRASSLYAPAQVPKLGAGRAGHQPLPPLSPQATPQVLKATECTG